MGAYTLSVIMESIHDEPANELEARARVYKDATNKLKEAQQAKWLADEVAAEDRWTYY